MGILAACRRFGNRRFHYAGRSFVILTGTFVPLLLRHWTLAFSVSFSPWYNRNGWLGVKHQVTYLLTVLFCSQWNNLKIISTCLPENDKCSNFAVEMQASFWITQEFIAETTKNATPMAARGFKTDTCATENPELGIFRTGKQRNSKTCPEIFMLVFIFLFSYTENLSIQNTPESFR